jgi:hypothetical protein
VLQVLFGARAQVVIGALAFVVGSLWWGYIEVAYSGELSGEPVVAAIFRVSMFFGLVACYAIIATGLGYRATERVEAKVEADAGQVDATAEASVSRIE